MKQWIVVGVLAWALAGGVAFAEDEEADEQETAEESESKDKESPVPAIPRAESTQHQVSLGGQVLKYTATVGWLILKDVKNKDDTKRDEPIARFGYTAYTLNGVKDPARRPVTFAFNGGPGSASIWLHMGALGPRRVVVNDGAYAPPPPAQLVDNEYSILDATDLVMIDPVGTGFSKPVGKAKGKQFWAWTRTSSPWAISSAATSPRTAAGARRSTCWEKVTAACAGRDSRGTSSRTLA